ncbi:MAG: uracil-DNA glycosylase [Akkermansia sp.]
MAMSFPNMVVDYLRSLQKRGITQIPIDEGARQILRQWVIASRQKRQLPTTSSRASSPESLSGTKKIESCKEEMPICDDDPILTLHQMIAQEQMIADQSPTPSPLHLIPCPIGNTLEEQLASLQKIAEQWPPSKALKTLRDTMVFATGTPHTQLMLIGEAPGFHEERLREPFVGPAGDKLNAILKAMGMPRPSVYISNIVKFRPSLPNQTTNNRAPNAKEIAACLPLISKEIELIKPRAIVALGATAAHGLLGEDNTPLSSLRGKFHEFLGIPVRVTYHPSYLLRTDELSERRKVWEDMLSVMELLGMPISDKQRNYFLPKQ